MKQKSITKVLKVCDKTMKQMKEYYEYSKRDKMPPYSFFQADDGETVVTLYTSGKVVFQGKDADLASDFWIETEKINSGANALIEKDKKKENKSEVILPFNINSIGSDEVGTGDFFGPIVVSASYVSYEDIDFLTSLGVRDSKKLTDDKILKVVPLLIKRIPYYSLILDNKSYNENYSNDMNMNRIKAVLHNKVLCEMVNRGYKYDYVVVDQFEYPKSYFNHIKEAKYKFNDIFFMTKAEDKCLSVACSSMISRYIFLNEMKKLNKKYNVVFPLGASSQVDLVFKNLVEIYGIDEAKNFCKLNFNNYKKWCDRND